jgi:lipoprotein signal peptidase
LAYILEVKPGADCLALRAVAWRTSNQVAALEQGLSTSPAATVSAESTRIAGVNRIFRIVKVVEVVLILGGLLLALLLPQPRTWAAVGLGLMLEAAVLLVFDVFAHHRALVYTPWLSSART